MNMRACDECGLPIRTQERGAWREVRGFVPATGALTEVVFAKGTGKWLHRLCMEHRRYLAGEQLSLFGDK